MRDIYSRNFVSFHPWSLRGIYYALRAGIVIYSSGKQDINALLIKGAISVQLWHGAPMKKICRDNLLVHKPIFEKIKKLFLPQYYEWDVDYVVSTSDFFDQDLCSAFGVMEKQILKTGYPRNDVFFDKNPESALVRKWKEKYRNPLIIGYLPTFRDNHKDVDLLLDYEFDAQRFDNFLSSIGAIMYTKGHYVSGGYTKTSKTERIIHLHDNEILDVNLLLKSTDILITDYSGIYFDFLLTKRPVIFAAFDLDKYLSECRELYRSYDTYVCGPVVSNWKDVEYGVKRIVASDPYVEAREEKSTTFNSYARIDSTRHLVARIKNF